MYTGLLSLFAVLCCCFSHIQLFATLWTVAHETLLSVGFSRQEYLSELPYPPLWDSPYPGIEPTSLMSPSLEGRFFATSTTWEALCPLR